MEYLEWLRGIGHRVSVSGITEELAAVKALPLENPGCVKMKSINRIVVHHSATETGNAEFFRVLHRIINGWNDIGYHYVIGNGSFSRDGEIETGRALPFRGAHARGGNEDSIGVCLVGNFDVKPPTDAQMISLAVLFKELSLEYSIDRDSVTLHRLIEGSSTRCPGKRLTLKDILYLFDNK